MCPKVGVCDVDKQTGLSVLLWYSHFSGEPEAHGSQTNPMVEAAPTSPGPPTGEDPR